MNVSEMGATGDSRLLGLCTNQIKDADRLLKSSKGLSGRLTEAKVNKIKEHLEEVAGLISLYKIGKKSIESLSFTISKETETALTSLEEKIGELEEKCERLKNRILPSTRQPASERQTAAQLEPGEHAAAQVLPDSPEPTRGKKRPVDDQLLGPEEHAAAPAQMEQPSNVVSLKLPSELSAPPQQKRRKTTIPALAALSTMGTGVGIAVNVAGGLSMATLVWTLPWLLPAGMAAAMAHRAPQWTQRQKIVAGIAAGTAALGFFALVPVASLGIPAVAHGVTTGIVGGSWAAGEAAGRFARKPPDEEGKRPPIN